MVLTIVLVDNEEHFIRFLNPELISIEEVSEEFKLRSISVAYYVEDFENAKKDFKLGNKLYISGDKNVTDCLYVINTSIERDYFDENNITFEAEEALVELNYAPLFTQTEVTSENDFTVTNEGVITLDRNALGFWFGGYFNIGIIQDCLDNHLLKIHPKATMTLIDLLRYIEEQTSNVFITRYEKDINTNVIHRYLDFLNPKDSDKSWEVVIDYDYPLEELSPNVNVPSDEVIIQSADNDSDPLVMPNRVPVEDLVLRLVKNEEVLFEETALNIGFDSEYTDYEITLKYDKPNLLISVLKEVEDDNDNLTFNTVTLQSVIELPPKVELQLYDSTNNRIIFKYGINPQLGVIKKDILDLGFNSKNIKHEIEETDTFRGIAPIFTVEELTHGQLNTVINDWINLEVTKGDIVPMIVQRISSSAYPSIAQNNPTNYWHNPVKTMNNDGNKEYDKATAYWKAPFSKVSGEIFVADYMDTGTEYNKIFMRPDLELDPLDTDHHIKIGTVETSDTDKYAIFNDVCNKLKEKRYPELNIEVDVANYKNNEYNNYDLFDRVYVKIPSFENLVVATVSKIIRNVHDIGATKIELGNYSINTKVEQKETQLSAENKEVTYPGKFNFIAKLETTDDEPLPLHGKFVSVTLLKKEDGESYNYTGTTYNRTTNENGEIRINNISLTPGNYTLECNFGGDETYESSTITAKINVNGIYYNTQNQKITSSGIFWSKYGHSPNGKYVTTEDWAFLKDQESKGNLIIGIGKAVTNADKAKWGTKIIETVFERKCPHCGSTKLYWGYAWNKKSDSGYFKPTKTVETGALSGRIICQKCGASYDVLGNGGNKKLTIKKSTKKSSKSRLSDLKAGKLKFGILKKIISKKNIRRNTGNVIVRGTPTKAQSGKVPKKIKETAKNIVGGDTGVKAVKILANWISKNIKTESRDGFYQTTAKTLARRKGNDACKTDLLIQMCDAVGVQEAGIGVYYVYTRKITKTRKKTKSKKSKTKNSHVFAKINGNWVDVCKKSPWGHYLTGYGALKNATITKYPALPFNRKY